MIASLDLDPRKFIGGANKALGKLGQVEGRFGKLGGMAAQGARNAGANIARLGIIAAGAVTVAVRGGIASLAELEDATTSVQGAIDQVGIQGQVTAGDVAKWANEIEASVQAAFDDKAITAAATNLIRYGKVTPKNLRPALVVMTDLAAKTGDVDSASSLLAKAMAAPEKAAGRLARVGVILTDEQQKQIKAMVKAGDTAGAQAVLLDALAASTKGAAEASAGPYRDALNTMSDASEDIQRLLGEGFLPIIQRVAGILREKMLDPAFIKDVRDFGKTLAGAFDKLIEAGGRIPWGQIGDSLKIAGTGAKALFDAFTSLPPWVQTAVLTGWGLNKLTGGALSGLAGEGIKIAFKEFAGRGATPANPLFVKDVMGGLGKAAPGAAPAAAAGGAAAGLLGTAGLLAGFVAIGESLASLPGSFLNFKGTMDAVANKDLPAAGDAFQDFVNGLPALNPFINKELFKGPLEAIEKEAARISANVGLEGAMSRSAIDKVADRSEANRLATVTGIDKLRATEQTLSASEQAKLAAVRERIEANRIAVQGVQRTTAGVSRSVERGDGAVVNAIRNIPRPIVNVFVSGAARLAAINYQSAVPTRRGPLEDETRR